MWPSRLFRSDGIGTRLYLFCFNARFIRKPVPIPVFTGTCFSERALGGARSIGLPCAADRLPYSRARLLRKMLGCIRPDGFVSMSLAKQSRQLETLFT
jgi:hypothetical protein